MLVFFYKVLSHSFTNRFYTNFFNNFNGNKIRVIFIIKIDFVQNVTQNLNDF